MGEGDKTDNKLQDLKGQAKEKLGAATDNDRLQNEGKADQSSANLKQAGENVKDALGMNDRK